MTRPRHDRSALERFLRREYRQVWARHRVTGEYVFLAEGEADARRAEARTEWACPVPGCDGPISTRGKSKRDHFFHVNPAGHGEGESEWHLQSKAMLRQWAQARGGNAVEVREEETAKDRASGMFRRADVMVTWTDSRRKIAFEVEYKPYTAESWLAKHHEYNDAGIGCVWVLGHLPRYLKQPRKPQDWPAHQPWDRFKWSPLTRAIAAEGLPVLFINPIERSVATVVVDGAYTFDEARSRMNFWNVAKDVGPRFGPRFDWDDEDGRLVVDSLDDCVLDEMHGLITPTMRWVMDQRAAIAAKAKSDFETWKDKRKRAETDAAARRTRDEAAWQACDLRRRVIARCGSVPAFLNQELPSDAGVSGHPAHWHAQLFQDLVLAPTRNGTFGQTFSVSQIYGMVSAHFRLDTNPSLRGRAVTDFLNVLRKAGFIEFQTDLVGRVKTSVTVVANLDHPPSDRRTDKPPRQQTGRERRPRRERDLTICPDCRGSLRSYVHRYTCWTPEQLSAEGKAAAQAEVERTLLDNGVDPAAAQTLSTMVDRQL